MKNLGWLYYRNYFDFDSLQRSIKTAQEQNNNLPKIEKKNPTTVEEETIEHFFSIRNKTIFDEPYLPNHWLKVVADEQTFDLTTTYPGLISGIGVKHETGKSGELKLGFCFDYTTGLPYLPGSTVKGAIRQVFPNHLRKKASKLKDTTERQLLLTKANHLELYCIGLFKKKLNVDITSIQLLQIEWHVFEGKTIKNISEIVTDMSIDFYKMEENPIGVYDSDIFHDTYITKSNNEHQLILNSDFITPHKHPLKNPIPLLFMKILPNVTLRFNFDLKNSKIDNIDITPEIKRQLFRQILLDFGIGAKTNVGYGQFSE